jgi:serine/threonine-protein kinase
MPALELVGRTLKGTWDVERRLASGGMGTVYVARHTRTGRRYALKTVLPSAQLSPDAIARFEREARAATAIGHAGIAAVHDFDRTSEGVHYLVMDLLVGESLESRLARVGRLPWPEARRVALEVGDALAAAHRASVLHRDVKPSNVFMASREGAAERAMLVDFGLAKPITPGRGDAVTRTGAIVGTAHYMAPEQARSEPVDERTDVYGLGATIYEMVAGVPPFLGASPIAVLAMLLEQSPIAPSVLASNVPPAVDALVLRALAKPPPDRFPDVPAMMRAIEAS